MDILEKPSDEEKKRFIDEIGKGTYIADYSKSNKLFFDTSCVLTAAVLRYRLSQKLWWKDVYYSEDKSNNFPVLPETFQVGFGEFGDYDEHIFTYHKGKIYESFYRKYAWKVRECDKPIVEIINEYRDSLNIGHYVIYFPYDLSETLDELFRTST